MNMHVLADRPVVIPVPHACFREMHICMAILRSMRKTQKTKTVNASRKIVKHIL